MTGLALGAVAIERRGEALFRPLDLSVGPGEIAAVTGPSGIGKSTLLAFIAGVLDPVFEGQGDVLIDGEAVTDLPPEARRIGMVYQDHLLFPHLSVGQNLGFALASEISGRAARRAHIEEALTGAGLYGYFDRDPATLSGGERARVALLRTMLSAPRALLLDEPLSGLDPARRTEIRDYIRDHVLAANIPTLIVSHDEEDTAAATGPVIALQPAR